MRKTSLLVSILGLGCSDDGPKRTDTVGSTSTIYEDDQNNEWHDDYGEESGVPSPEGPDSDLTCSGDLLEPNDEPAQAAGLDWGYRHQSDGLNTSKARADASLCPADHDWYVVSIDELGHWKWGGTWVSVDVIVDGASWCGGVDGCDGNVLKPDPSNIVGVEIYDMSMLFLKGDFSTRGRVNIDTVFVPYHSEWVFVHVYSSTESAEFDYELHIEARDHEEVPADCDC